MSVSPDLSPARGRWLWPNFKALESWSSAEFLRPLCIRLAFWCKFAPVCRSLRFYITRLLGLNLLYLQVYAGSSSISSLESLHVSFMAGKNATVCMVRSGAKEVKVMGVPLISMTFRLGLICKDPSTNIRALCICLA